MSQLCLPGSVESVCEAILRICLISVVVVGSLMSLIFYVFRYPLLSLYSNEPEVINFGISRMNIIFSTYFLCGIMDVLVGSIRGLGYSVLPMIVSLLGACGLRILWLFTIFRMIPTLPILYISYPVSWGITLIVHLICFELLHSKYKLTTAN